MVNRVAPALFAGGWLWLATGLAFALDDPAPPSTADAERAKQLFETGLEQLRQQHWPEAEQLFRDSLAIVPRSSTEYDLALVLFKRGKLQESAERLQRLLSGERYPEDARYGASAKALLSQVLSQLSMLYLEIDPPTAQLRVDGQSLALTGPQRAVPLDPGSHRVEVSAEGFEASRFEITLVTKSDTRRSVQLLPLTAAPSLQPSAAAPAAALVVSPPPVRSNDAGSSLGPWLTIGGGAALLAGALVTGILAEHADGDFTRQCPTHRDCALSLRPERDRIAALGLATDLLLGSGLAVTTAGVAWKLFFPGSPAERHDLAIGIAARVRN